MQQAQRNQAVAAVAKTNEIEEPPVSFRSIEDLQQSGINVRYYVSNISNLIVIVLISLVSYTFGCVFNKALSKL